MALRGRRFVPTTDGVGGPSYHFRNFSRVRLTQMGLLPVAVLAGTTAKVPGRGEADPVAGERCGGCPEGLRVAKHAAGKQIDVYAWKNVLNTDAPGNSMLRDGGELTLNVLDV